MGTHRHDSSHAHSPHGSHAPHAHRDHPHGHGTAVLRAFSIGIGLNLLFVALEIALGFWSHSLALLADASHNFGDVIGLLLTWGATRLAQRRPSPHFTYGWRGSTILAALGNSTLLLVVTGAILWASVDRLRVPAAVNSGVMIWVAAFGVVVNGASAILFLAGRKEDLNVRAAFLHMVADGAVSLAVIVAGALITVTGWYWLDPVASIAIALVILAGTWDLLRQSLRLALQAVPAGVDSQAVRQYLTEQPGVREAHDLHIWAMSTSENVMTVHLVMPAGHPGDAFLEQLADELDVRFHLGHVTLQVETGDSKTCRLAAEHVI